MPLPYLLSLPFISALIALCAVYICIKLGLKGNNRQVGLEGQIDHRIDAIVETFKERIPMVGMFLSGAKEEELKSYARIELVKMLPALKDYLKSSFSNVKYKVAGTALLVGFLLGTLEALLLYFLV